MEYLKTLIEKTLLEKFYEACDLSITYFELWTSAFPVIVLKIFQRDGKIDVSESFRAFNRFRIDPELGFLSEEYHINTFIETYDNSQN
jgi:hypothetical protein